MLLLLLLGLVVVAAVDVAAAVAIEVENAAVADGANDGLRRICGVKAADNVVVETAANKQ